MSIYFLFSKYFLTQYTSASGKGLNFLISEIFGKLSNILNFDVLFSRHTRKKMHTLCEKHQKCKEKSSRNSDKYVDSWNYWRIAKRSTGLYLQNIISKFIAVERKPLLFTGPTREQPYPTSNLRKLQYVVKRKRKQKWETSRETHRGTTTKSMLRIGTGGRIEGKLCVSTINYGMILDKR